MNGESLRTVLGTVVRTVDDGFGYVLLDADRKTYFFDSSAIPPTATSSSLAANGIFQGSTVEVQWDADSAIVYHLTLVERAAATVRAPLDELDYAKPIPPEEARIQLELDPRSDPKGQLALGRAIPMKMREFGRTLDTGPLLPGDLLLSRDVSPDGISRAIAEVQERGGYNAANAHWTHAAMYVGDGQHVVEATFESVFSGGSVRLSSLDDYCTGEYILRFRRPSRVESDIDRWRLCVRALSRLHKDYHFAEAVRMWFRVMISKEGFNTDKRRPPVSEAAICSSLYADSYNEATRRTPGEVGGVCVPAWLSGSDEFSDVACAWLEIM